MIKINYIRKSYVFFIPVILIFFSGFASAEFLDDAPYWFWAEKWEGELSVEYKEKYEAKAGGAEHRWEARGTIEVKSAVFEDRGLEYNLVSYSSSGNNALVTWWKKEDAVGVGEKGYFEAFTVDKGETNTAIDTDSVILMDIETGVFRINLLLPENIEIPLNRKYHFQGEGADGEKYWKIVEDETYQSTKIPHFMGQVEKEFPEPGNGFDDMEDMNDGDYELYTFSYRLQPSYDETKWREEYLKLLRSQRQRYKDKWESIKEKADSNSIIYRAAERTLNNLESWLNVLADDGIRVCKALVDGKAPGLLSRIKKDYSSYVVRDVKRGASSTANTIHRYLYHFYDSDANSIYAIYERLPYELKQLYTLERLKALNDAFLD